MKAQRSLQAIRSWFRGQARQALTGRRTLIRVLALGLTLTLAANLSTAWETEPQRIIALLERVGTVVSAPLGTGFTYQGQLSDADGPVDGTCDLTFRLYDQDGTGGVPLGTETFDNKEINGGLFTVQLDFGASAFAGDARWLEIAVDCGKGDTTLSPRQPVTPSPYTLYALSSGDSWSRTGNEGTTPGTHFLGTTDDQALELRVNGARALRLEPKSESPNVIGGHSVNSVGWGWGATISGGGRSGSANQVVAAYGTVGGGSGNTASGGHATVGGGASNEALGDWTTVGGGHFNKAHNTVATVGGGTDNEAIGWYATVPGGRANVAGGEYSFAAGRAAKANYDGSFVWADSTDADFASTHPDQFLVRAGGGVRVVKGTNSFADTVAALQVEHAGSYGEAAWFRQIVSNTVPVLKLVKPAGSTNGFLSGEYYGDGGATFWIDKDGGYHPSGADFAEALPVVGNREAYEPGDVLVVSARAPGNVERCTRPYDPAVVGVYSTQPGFVGGGRMGVDEIPVALLGIVPVKASTENGPIGPGDLLTASSTPGHAMRCEGVELCFGRTIGKALEALAAAQSTGVIKVLVTLQ